MLHSAAPYRVYGDFAQSDRSRLCQIFVCIVDIDKNNHNHQENKQFIGFFGVYFPADLSPEDTAANPSYHHQ